MKNTPQLSPASFVTVHSPYRKTKHSPIHPILTELLVQEKPIGIYNTQVQALRQRFNDMYYKFLTNLTSIHYNVPLSRAQQENLHSLFDELLEMRTLLEKDLISTR